MDEGHQAAGLAAAQKAEALLDAQTELSAEERAAAITQAGDPGPNAGG